MQTQTKPDIVALYNKAASLKDAGQPEAALRLFGQVIVARPDLAEAWWQAALIFLDGDDFPQALRHAAKAVDLKPAEPTVWATWADAVALSGAKDAEKDLLDRLRRSALPAPFKVRLQDRFGQQRSNSVGPIGKAPRHLLQALAKKVAQGDHAAVVADATAITRAFPDCALAFNALGMALSGQKRQDVALGAFRAAIAIDPFFAAAFFNLGLALGELGKTDESAQMLRAAIARCPDFEDALVAYGSKISAKRPVGALHFLSRAAALNPSSVDAMIAKGRTLNELREFESAISVLRDALVHATGSRRVPALLALANSFSRFGQVETASSLADEALQIDPSSTDALALKARSLQTLGRFDEARPFFLKAMETDPKTGGYFRGYVTGNKIKPGDPLLDRMRQLIEQPYLQPSSEADFGFAIAKALEDQKDYTNAFPYLKRANDIVARLNPYDHKGRLDQIRRLRDACASSAWERKVEGAEQSRQIFVTGMPRSGTTLIEQIISSHSRVTGGDELEILPNMAIDLLMSAKRPDRWQRLDDMADADIAALGRTYLTEVRKRFPTADIVSDKSISSYLHIGLIKLALPNARVIVVRRDPRDNLLSIYRNRFPERAHHYAYDLRALAEYYATFVEVIDFWRAEVPDAFTEVQYEDLVANPEEQSRRLIAACGLEWQDACLDIQNNQREVRTLSVYQVRQPISGKSVKAWQHYEKELAPMIDILAERGLLPD